MIRERVELKKKKSARRLIKQIVSADDITCSESFNLVANKKNEHCPKNQMQK